MGDTSPLMDARGAPAPSASAASREDDGGSGDFGAHRRHDGEEEDADLLLPTRGLLAHRDARRWRVVAVSLGVAAVLLFGLLALSAAFNIAGLSSSSGDGDGDDGAGVKPVPDAMPRTVVLISLDGFRNEYLKPLKDGGFGEAAPFLKDMAQRGVRASQGMRPVFPTKTFPNHYSLVTGLLPAWHGIVANTMFSPVLNYTFTISNAAAVQDSRWWLGEPVWVTNEKQGGVSAAMFWPGSEAEIGGVRPTYYYPYDSTFPYAARFDRVLEWLRMPGDDPKRPNFICVYADKIDTDGHQYGPGSPNVLQSISLVDSLLKSFFADIDADASLKDTVQIIVSGDHGMAPSSRNKVVLLDEIVNMTADVARVVDWSPNAYIIPRGAPGSDARRAHEDAILAAVNQHPNLQGWRREDIPAVYNYRDSDRIMPIFVSATDNWQISSRDQFGRNPQYYDGGFHGMNNSVAEMQTIFIGHGSAFRTATDVQSIPNLELYNIMCQILGLAPAPNNGTASFYNKVLV
jgi:predicted AlkP superfamily pyrophosphatase or phosphodiesterase